ncbi:azurin [Aquincola sp. MAHUQ-54]|uniref:Azurin n=1 Tax=Aquincola agrisoli TaxID=3119538 RepID=A0AAW9QJH0_9BURK
MKTQQIAAVVLATLIGAPAMAAQCDVEIGGNDAMQFDKSSIAVPASCKQFTVKLKHTGKLPKAAMGHNWVLSKTADVQGVAADGIPAGADKAYVKPGDARVIAHTKVIGGGETDSVSFDVAKLKAGESYTYFCSFPGHSGIMKGTLTLAK